MPIPVVLFLLFSKSKYLKSRNETIPFTYAKIEMQRKLVQDAIKKVKSVYRYNTLKLFISDP
jgi:hypothetical protein